MHRRRVSATPTSSPPSLPPAAGDGASLHEQRNLRWTQPPHPSPQPQCPSPSTRRATAATPCEGRAQWHPCQEAQVSQHALLLRSCALVSLEAAFPCNTNAGSATGGAEVGLPPVPLATSSGAIGSAELERAVCVSSVSWASDDNDDIADSDDNVVDDDSSPSDSQAWSDRQSPWMEGPGGSPMARDEAAAASALAAGMAMASTAEGETQASMVCHHQVQLRPIPDRGPHQCQHRAESNKHRSGHSIRLALCPGSALTTLEWQIPEGNIRRPALARANAVPRENWAHHWHISQRHGTFGWNTSRTRPPTFPARHQPQCSRGLASPSPATTAPQTPIMHFFAQMRLCKSFVQIYKQTRFP